MDNLEKYIEAHREEFDNEKPRDQVWTKINESMPNVQPKKVGKAGWMWKAAAVLLLMTTVYLLLDRQQPQDKILAESGEAVLSEFDEAEKYFLSEIDKRRTQLAAYQLDEPMEKEFMDDLENLDKMYNSLKDDFGTSGNSEKVAEALIQNLRIRMEIINQQIMILERIKNKKSYENIEI